MDCWESPLFGSSQSKCSWWDRSLCPLIEYFPNSGPGTTCCYGSRMEFLFDLSKWLKIRFEGFMCWHKTLYPLLVFLWLWLFCSKTSWPQMFCTAPPFVRLELTAAEGIPCKILWLSSWFNTNTQVIWSKYWEVMVPAVWLCHDKENGLVYAVLPVATFTYELCLENQVWSLSGVALSHNGNCLCQIHSHLWRQSICFWWRVVPG